MLSSVCRLSDLEDVDIILCKVVEEKEMTCLTFQAILSFSFNGG